jgi:hypothetical protein
MGPRTLSFGSCGRGLTSRPPLLPTPSYASANHRSRRATYPAVCSRRATLLDNANGPTACAGTERDNGMLGRQLFGPGGDYHSRTLDRWAANPGRREGAIADSERRPLILRSSFSCAQPTEDRFQGHKMNIDLDSWEAGYMHGQQGGRPRCAIELDQVSYLSGFCHGRAWREQSRTKRPPLRALERRAHEPPQGRAGGSRSQTSSSDEASVRGSHQDRQCGMLHFLLPGGSHPHMKRRFTAA